MKNSQTTVEEDSNRSIMSVTEFPPLRK